MASCTESSEEESELRLLPPKKKPKSDTDLTKCIICQEKSSERLRSPTEAGLRSFKEAPEVRKDETFHRISLTFENLEALHVFWQGKCFQSYTSKGNLSFIKPLTLNTNCLFGMLRHVQTPPSPHSPPLSKLYTGCFQNLALTFQVPWCFSKGL